MPNVEPLTRFSGSWKCLRSACSDLPSLGVTPHNDLAKRYESAHIQSVGSESPQLSNSRFKMGISKLSPAATSKAEWVHKNMCVGQTSCACLQLTVVRSRRRLACRKAIFSDRQQRRQRKCNMQRWACDEPASTQCHAIETAAAGTSRQQLGGDCKLSSSRSSRRQVYRCAPPEQAFRQRSAAAGSQATAARPRCGKRDANKS